VCCITAAQMQQTGEPSMMQFAHCTLPRRVYRHSTGLYTKQGNHIHKDMGPILRTRRRATRWQTRRMPEPTRGCAVSSWRETPNPRPAGAELGPIPQIGRQNGPGAPQLPPTRLPCAALEPRAQGRAAHRQGAAWTMTREATSFYLETDIAAFGKEHPG
jgi:hypothetical protein